MDASRFADASDESRGETEWLSVESASRTVLELELLAEPLLWMAALLESRDESLSRSCRPEVPAPMPDELPIPPDELPPTELLLWLLEGANPPPWVLLEEELAELLVALGDALWLALPAEEELDETLGELVGALYVAGAEAAEAAGERCA